jgi:hypothetical protein
MAAIVSTRVVWDYAKIRALKTDPDVAAATHAAADGLTELLRAMTPRATGAGADSIGARDSRAKGAVDVGWDAAHYYLIFPEYGTKFIDEQRFARGALDRYIFE